jgi:predicted O-methyltransferase YrrM
MFSISKSLIKNTIKCLVFVASFLSFSVQPLFSKLLLPTFGGSAMVWTTSSLFFQILLLISYFYVFILERLSYRKQSILHICVAIVVIFAATSNVFGVQSSFSRLPFLINNLSSENEILRILKVGILSVGGTFLFLGTVSTSLQILAVRIGIKNPYDFYRASNLGSLIGLFSFPFLIEPFFSSARLVETWSILVLIEISLIGLLYVFAYRLPYEEIEETSSKVPQAKDILKWIVLAAFPVTLMLASTNYITSKVTPIPYLWILPFGAYLISYILAFGIYKRESLIPVISILLGYIMFSSLILNDIRIVDYFLQLLLLVFLTFSISLIFHTIVYNSRPNKLSLSYFYLSLSFGGMIGGLAISIGAPLIFKTYLELEILLAVGTAVMLFFYSKSKPIKYFDYRFLTIVGLAILIPFIYQKYLVKPDYQILTMNRNFYGTLKVIKSDDRIMLFNGDILHGSQFLGEKSSIPTTYYGSLSGVGKIFSLYNEESSDSGKNLKVGVIGLGTGSLLAYCRPNDEYVLFEINEQVVQAAEDHFTYLDNCQNKTIKIGDGRTILAHDSQGSTLNGNYDLLVIDAFTDDAIPTHLLTKEAAQLYLDNLASNGMILYHISNRYLNLYEVINGIAESTNSYTVRLSNKAISEETNESNSEWMIITKSKEEAEKIKAKFDVPEPTQNESVIWTDDYTNVLRVVNL